jgi:serine/threonine protein phosphatase PrpC/predicted Ser/Thr protein kinase
MPKRLSISFGQFSDKGVKPINQDFHGVSTPSDSLLSTKGIAIALADGISSSQLSQEASAASVHALMEDYYCTSQAWSVKTSVHKVLNATNSWLHGQTRRSQYRSDFNKGYVCTLSAIILKSTTAHIFHVGDCRVYRLRDNELEQLTQDHRVRISEHEDYLSRAMGFHPYLEMDYTCVPLKNSDVFLLMTDGVYEHISGAFMQSTVREYAQTLDQAAQIFVQQAIKHGSTDNLTAQIICIDELPLQSEIELFEQLTQLPFSPPLDVGATIDNWHIIRSLYVSSRSHVYLAENCYDPSEQVVVKIPSVEQQKDTAYLDRFLMEDWIAQRLNNPHVVKSPEQEKKSFIYSVMEYVPGRTLTQWMRDNPKPDLESVRVIVEQIAKGLQAFHRLEMLHQDCRPENILIDAYGQVKLIDFGSAKVAGILEINSPLIRSQSLGTAQFMAPEYFMGEGGRNASDIFSLGVITYHMLKGELPYGAEVARCKSRYAQLKLKYKSVLDDKRDLPAWLDSVLKKATHIQPHLRYQELSEFIYDLRHPTDKMLNQAKGPLLERNPIAFWQSVSAVLFVLVIVLFYRLNL